MAYRFFINICPYVIVKRIVPIHRKHAARAPNFFRKAMLFVPQKMAVNVFSLRVGEDSCRILQILQLTIKKDAIEAKKYYVKNIYYIYNI